MIDETILPLRERVFQAIRHGAFYCRPDELGRFNMRPGICYHIDGAEPARVSAEDGLAELEREGWIRRHHYWGPDRLELFYEGRTLYSWVAAAAIYPTSGQDRNLFNLAKKISERRSRFSPAER